MKYFGIIERKREKKTDFQFAETHKSIRYINSQVTESIQVYVQQCQQQEEHCHLSGLLSISYLKI